MKDSDIKSYVSACLGNEIYMKNVIRRYGGAGTDITIDVSQMADAIIRLHKSVKELAIKHDLYEDDL